MKLVLLALEPLIILVVAFTLSTVIYWKVSAVNHPYLRGGAQGLSVGLATMIGVYLLLLGYIVLSYSGECLPNMFLGGDVNQPCSRIEHFAQHAGLIFILLLVYWPLPLAFLLFCILASLTLARRFGHK